jgi:hypothetical protein
MLAAIFGFHHLQEKQAQPLFVLAAAIKPYPTH